MRDATDSQPLRTSSVPPWLARLGALGWRVLAIVALAFVLGAIAAELSSVTASVLVALIVSAALLPTARGLSARGLSSSLAAAVACLVGVVVVGVAMALIAVALLPHVRETVLLVREGIDDLREQLEGLGLPPFIGDALDSFVRSLGSIDFTALAGPTVSVVTVLVLAGFLTYFLLADGARGWAWLMGFFDRRQGALLTKSSARGLYRIAGYLRRTTALAALDAAVVAAVLFALGVPLAGPLAVLVFLAGFVPYLGAITAMPVVALVTLAEVGPIAAGLVVVAIVATAVVATRLLDGTPIGARVDIHPVIVLAAIPAGAALFGVLGLVAVLPVTVLLFGIGRALVAALSLEDVDPLAGPVPAGVPRWLDRLAQWAWRILAVVGVLAVVVATAVLVPIVSVPGVLALVIAATLGSSSERLQRMGLSAGQSALIGTVGAALVVVVGLIGSVALAAGPLGEILETAFEGAEDTGIAWLRDLIAGIGAGIAVDVVALLRSLVLVGLIVILALLLAYFFLRDGPAWWRSTVGGLRSPERETVDAVGRQSVNVLGGYMVGTAIISLFGAITSALLMVVLGLPLALPIGLFTFFASFIPYIGSFASTAFATLVAVALGDTTTVIVMLAFTVIFNLIQGSFITPIVYGRTMSLHPAIILLAIPAGADVAGILGMFLVVPFVAIIATTWRSLLAIAGGHATANPASPPGDDP